MRNYLLGGIAIASAFTFMIASAPVEAACWGGPSCSGARVGNFRAPGAGPAQFRYQHQGFANNNRRGGYGIGVGAAALATGVIIGGVLQQNQGYYPDDSYPVYADQGPGYYDAGPGYYDAGPQVAADGDTVAYCERTYRSYDPASGTYLGYDGLRHPCP